MEAMPKTTCSFRVDGKYSHGYLFLNKPMEKARARDSIPLLK